MNATTPLSWRSLFLRGRVAFGKWRSPGLHSFRNAISLRMEDRDMESMGLGAPGGAEIVIMLFMMLFVWGIPIAIAIWFIITINGIRRDIAAIRQRLEVSQQ